MRSLLIVTTCALCLAAPANAHTTHHHKPCHVKRYAKHHKRQCRKAKPKHAIAEPWRAEKAPTPTPSQSAPKPIEDTPQAETEESFTATELTEKEIEELIAIDEENPQHGEIVEIEIEETAE